jgi:oxygen-dependent protoporphyrinogen oxidase
MGLDFVLPPLPMNGDESLGNFVSRRLGRPAYEALIEPLMSGIYAGDGDRLSLKATFPYLRDLELKHGGLVKGALATRRKMSRSGQKAPGTRSAFLTPRTGLAAIVEALVEVLMELGVRMRLGSPAVRLNSHLDAAGSHSPGRYILELSNGEAIEADGIILAAPANHSGSILSDLAPDLSRELGEIEYASTATASLAYRKTDLPRPLDGYGYIIPRREGRKALACTWTSTKFPHRAPDGYALLRVFIGRAGQGTDLPSEEDQLIQIAREELALTMEIKAEPVLSRAFYWPEAMPQYNMGHPERLTRIEQQLQALRGIALAGAGYHGIGIPDCIHSGELAAKKIQESLPELMV